MSPRFLALTSILILTAAPGFAQSVRPSHTQADVAFMSGMIAHHAQAVQIAGWAPSHGASPAVRRLCERIVVAQRDARPEPPNSIDSS
jgi:uncharacterized protein (DUF305 family)